MKILITGASGYLAFQLINLLHNQKDTEIIIASSNLKKLKEYYCFDDIEMVSNEVLLYENWKWKDIDCVVHTAFCRKSDGKLLVDSLNFFKAILGNALNNGVRSFMNISSQSVYGSDEGILPTEEGKLNPHYLYAFAKYTSELLMDEIVAQYKTDLEVTNVRLASLIGPSHSVPDNVVYKFICSSINNGEFKVIGGQQKFSFLDVRDAASAILQLINSRNVKAWKRYYNLGPQKQTSMMDLAEVVSSEVEEKLGKKVSYTIEDKHIQLNAGMNSNLLYEELNWTPLFELKDTIRDTIDCYLNWGGCFSGESN